MRKHRGRPAKHINTERYVNKFIDEHRDYLRKKGVDPFKLRIKAQEDMQAYYHGKANIDRALRNQINSLTMGKDEYLANLAKSYATFEGDRRQFNNKKVGKFIETEIYTTTADGTEATIVGYYPVMGTNYVIAQVIIKNYYSDSPYMSEEYMTKDQLGLV